MNKKWTEQEILDKLVTPYAISRAMLAIYRQQTIIEQGSKSTYIKNGVGFSSSDSRIGTYMGSWLEQDINRVLYGKLLITARKLAIKYRKQLVKIANKEI